MCIRDRVSSAKWAGRAPAGDVLVRAFVPDTVGALARASEDEVLADVTAHVTQHLGATRPPTRSWITRWDALMPKFTVGHVDRVRAAEAALAPTPWRVAGSALHGVGVPDCIADGRLQARAALTQATVCLLYTSDAADE